MAGIQDYKKHFYSAPKILSFNNAGLAPISSVAKNKISYWADRFYQEGFATDHDYMEAVFQARTSLAVLMGTSANEIAFFQSTAGAISQLCFQFPLKKDDQVITWDQEYASNLYPWREACLRSGATLVTVSSEKDFSTPVEKIVQKITPQTKVIAISWVQFQTGAITDLKALGKITSSKNIFLFVDVMQGLGLHPFPMKEWGVDAAAGGSHKWLTSPVGVGFLALDAKHTSMIRPHNIGSSTFGTCDDPTDLFCEPKKDALKFEAGSKQVLEIAALGASVDLILETGVEVIGKEVLRLSDQLAQGLKNQGYTVFHGPTSIVNFVPDKDSPQKLQRVPCHYALRGPGVRLSPHAFNTDQEVEKIIRALSRA